MSGTCSAVLPRLTREIWGRYGEIWGGHLQRGLAPVDEHEVVAEEVAEDAPG